MHPWDMRVGVGNDTHQLVSDRKLILGGVEIPHTRGLKGHSDADVLTHAICDALLGAAALGDIGLHFPDTDPAYKGVSSLKLLSATVEKLKEKGFGISNIDATLFAQAPKVGPYRSAMVETIAGCSGLDPDRVNIKATTTERLGPEGREEGISATAVALIFRKY